MNEVIALNKVEVKLTVNADAVREALQAAGLDVPLTAALLGVSAATVDNMLGGTVPRAQTLAGLSALLGVHGQSLAVFGAPGTPAIVEVRATVPVLEGGMLG
jgi:transcriptional regulator with XRE-family HTH domain